MGRLIEKLWDCKYCGTKGIGGSKRECPNCGKVRDVDTVFYMPNEVKYVPEEEASKINRNPDWLCQYCDTLNSASETVCKQCGAERTSENLDYFQNRKIRDNKNVSVDESTPSVINSSSETSNNFEQENERTSENSNHFDHDQESNRNSYSLIDGIKDLIFEYSSFIICFIAIVAIIAGLIWIFTPKKQNITVQRMYWERSIAVERYQTVEENGWTLPDGARLHETRSEIYTYKRVLDHYETKTRQVTKKRISGFEEKVIGYRDLGNGYAEEVTERRPIYENYTETEYYQEPIYRNEPVYGTKFYYEIDRWLYDRTLTSAGFDKEPYWADTSILGKDERESERKEKYLITGINSKGKSKEISLPYSQWNDLNVGDKVNIKVSIFGDGELTSD